MADSPEETLAPDSGPESERTPLTEAERSAVFRTGQVPVDRAAALRAGSTPIPKKFFLWVVLAFAVLGIGGVIGEKLIGSGGISALTSVPTTTLAGSNGSFPSGDRQGGPVSGEVDATPTAVTGLITLTRKPAPAVSLLQDQAGTTWSLAEAKGKVVVLTFFNAECDDICPVEAAEITQADQLLGQQRSAVDFVVVNTDPLETSLAPTPSALTLTHLDAVPNVTFLNGSLTELSTVWKHYGITVELNPTVRVATHTEAMYVIDRKGRLRLEATPFANENALGVYSLDPATIHSFAEGMADSASRLATRTS